jgi:hypothetical protein
MKSKLSTGIAVFATLVLAPQMSVADITGKWIMTAPRPNGAIHQTFNLEVGEEIASGPATGNFHLTGSIETPFGPFPVFGEVSDDTVYFVSLQHYKPDGMSLHIWQGTVVNDNEIRFEQSFAPMNGPGGRNAPPGAQDGPPGSQGGAPQQPTVPNMDPDWEGRGDQFVSMYTAYKTSLENPSLPRRPPPGGGRPPQPESD